MELEDLKNKIKSNLQVCFKFAKTETRRSLKWLAADFAESITFDNMDVVLAKIDTIQDNSSLERVHKDLLQLLFAHFNMLVKEQPDYNSVIVNFNAYVKELVNHVETEVEIERLTQFCKQHHISVKPASNKFTIISYIHTRIFDLNPQQLKKMDKMICEQIYNHFSIMT